MIDQPNLEACSQAEFRLKLALDSANLLGEIGFVTPTSNEQEEAVAALSKITAALLGGIAVLANSKNGYSLAALTRQLVEIEYLTYAVYCGHRAFETWYKSTKGERANAWAPRHFYSIDGSPFSKEEYQDHCELGGHPTPVGVLLTEIDPPRFDELFCEALVHTHSITLYLHEWLAANIPQRGESEVKKWYALSDDFKHFFANDTALARLHSRHDSWMNAGKPRP